MAAEPQARALDRAIRTLRLIAADDISAMPRQAQWRAYAAKQALVKINKMLAPTSPDPEPDNG